MMKRFTVFTVFALLLAFGAGQALAGSISFWPQSMNNTWNLVGLSTNGTTGPALKAVVVNSTTANDGSGNFRTYMNSWGQSVGNMSANATIVNATGGAGMTYSSLGGTSLRYIDLGTGPNGFPRSTFVMGLNGTAKSQSGYLTAMVVPTSGFSAMFALARGSFNNTAYNNATKNQGFTFLAMNPLNGMSASLAPLAINRYSLGGADGKANSSTWAVYALGPGNLMAGKLIFNRSNNNAYVYGLNNSATAKVGNWTTQLNTYTFGLRRGTSILIENATLSKSNSSFFGFTSGNAPYLSIGLKDAVEGSAADWASKTYNVIGYGFTTGNASWSALGTISTDASGNFAYGNVTVYNKTRTATIRPGGSAKVTYSRATKLFGTPLYSRTGGMDNLTIYNSTGAIAGSFLTLWEKNKKFGVGYAAEGSANAKAKLLIFVPATPTLGAINSLSMTGISAMGGSANLTVSMNANATYQWANEKGRYASTLTDANFRPFGDVRKFTAHYVAGLGSGGGSGMAANYTAYNYSLTGWGGPVSTLKLFKLIRRVGQDYKSETANSTREFPYANDGFGQSNRWWVSTDTAGLNVVQASQSLVPTNTYYVNFIVRDVVRAAAGGYDGNYTAAYVTDPQILGQWIPTASSGSSSSTGCVFNPTAGFGLEWLLLLIAPALGIIRSRLKK